SEQPFMRYRVEVSFEVQVHAPVASLCQEFFHPLDRLLASASRSKPVAVLGEIPLEYRFEQVFYCCFHRPVAHRRYAQRSLLVAAGFGSPNPASRLTVIAFAA